MSILIALGSRGLVEAPGLRVRPCPLRRVEVLSPCGRVAVDSAGRSCLLSDRVFDCPAGVEAALCWQGQALLLSGETDAVSLHQADGALLCLCPVGVYPRELCLLPGDASCAVTGGAEGTVSLLSLPQLVRQQVFRVPGSPCCLCVSRGKLYVLSCTGEEEVHSLLCRISLRTGFVEQLLALPGLPGSLAAESDGTLWAGVTERLAHISPDPVRLLSLRSGFGLIRRMVWTDGRMVAADPVLGQVLALERRGQGAARVLLQGDVRDLCLQP